MKGLKHTIVFGLAIWMAGFLYLGSTSAGEQYRVDPDHSSLIFKSTHFGLGHVYGRFNDFSGSYYVDTLNPAKSSVKFEVRAASVDSGNTKRDQHLKSPDFLNAKQFPLISFKSNSARKLNKDTAEVQGELTLHGVTRPLTVKVKRIGAGKDPWGNQRLGVETSFEVKRSEFGMKFMLDGIGDVIQVTLAAEGILEPGGSRHAGAD